MFDPIAELVITRGKAEIKIHSVIVGAKNESVQYNVKLYKPFCAFYSSIRFALFLQGNNFLFYFHF